MIHKEHMRLLLIISLLALLGMPMSAKACSCVWERDTMVTAEMLADSSIHIFSGTVVSTKVVGLKDELGRKDRYIKVTVRVHDVFKTRIPSRGRTITIYTGTDINRDCGIPFKKDASYFIVAFESARTKGLFTNYCYPTKALSDASRDIARLKN